MSKQVGILAFCFLIVTFVLHFYIFPWQSSRIYEKSPISITVSPDGTQNLNASGEYKTLTLLSDLDSKLFQFLLLATIILSLRGLFTDQTKKSRTAGLVCVILLISYAYFNMLHF